MINTYVKLFKDWFVVKGKLDSLVHKAPFVYEKELWWISFGENIGSEISGKSRDFTRPGIIFKKLSQSSYLVIPTTTKEKNGSWYVHLSLDGMSMNACLHQIRVVDYRRLNSKLEKMCGEDFLKVKRGFESLYVL